MLTYNPPRSRVIVGRVCFLEGHSFLHIKLTLVASITILMLPLSMQKLLPGCRTWELKMATKLHL